MKIRHPDTSLDAVGREHSELGIPPAETTATTLVAHPVLNLAAWFTLAVIGALTLYLAGRLVLGGHLHAVAEALGGSAFWSAVAVGFFAQAVDGALGMAYGVTATTILLSQGVTPAVASASVHAAEKIGRASCRERV